MATLAEMVSGQMMKHTKKVARLLEPLARISGIDQFLYLTIDKRGHFTCHTNSSIEWQEEYYMEKYFIQENLFSHPKFLPKGKVFLNDSSYLFNAEHNKIRSQKMTSGHYLAEIERDDEFAEIVFFGTDQNNFSIYNFYANEGRLLKEFVSFFKSEMKNELARALRDPLDLKEYKGSRFCLPFGETQEITPEERNGFLAEIHRLNSRHVRVQLSQREMQILQMLHRGFSVTQMAEAIHISPRTIESYFDRLRDKFQVERRRDLLGCLPELEALGIFSKELLV